MRLSTLHVLPSLLAALGALAWSEGQARPLRVAYTHSYACVPLGVAEDRQYWRDAGLQVELRGYQTSQEVTAALTSGEVDLAYDRVATWLDLALKGAPIAVVGETNWSHGGDKLLVRSNQTLAQLKGRPIAVCVRGSALLLFLREALLARQLALADFPIVEVPEQEAALELFRQGKVDAVVTNEPWAARIEAAGARVVATTADFAGVAPDGFAARRTQVDAATLERFFTVWFRAVAFLHDPGNAEAVANVASIYAFAGTETITAADVGTYATITPVHGAAGALKQNDLASGNVRQLVQRFFVFRRLQGNPIAEGSLVGCFDLDAFRHAAGRQL